MLKQHKKVLLTERRQAVTYELPIIQQGEILLISALLLHQKLKVKTRFNDWFQRRIEKYGFEINIDFYSNLSKSKTKPITDYLLSVDMAKEIAMLEENEIGRQIRKYFIAKEKELRGISQLPKESQLFKGLKCKTFNGRKMYQYTEVLERCGYNRRNNYAGRKQRYWMHFVMEGKLNFITEEFAMHLYHSRRVLENRKTMLASKPVITTLFGDNSFLLNAKNY
jgi:phage anti-repressor protein